eukprot:1147659-Pelagomonas_calceolata.AAC.6
MRSGLGSCLWHNVLGLQGLQGVAAAAFTQTDLNECHEYIHVVDLPNRRAVPHQPPQPTVRPAQSATEAPWLPEVPVRTITPMTASAAATAAATAGGVGVCGCEFVVVVGGYKGGPGRHTASH